MSNPVLDYMTAGQRAGTSAPVSGFHRAVSRDPLQGNALVIEEEEFEIIAHVGHVKRTGRLAPEGARQSGEVRLQADISQPLLVTQREADSAAGEVMADVIVWSGDRWIVQDVDDLTQHPIAMLRQRSYSLSRENPL